MEMEKGRNWEKMALINELNQGRKLANELKNHVDPTTSAESCEFLLEKLLSSYDKALSILKSNASMGQPLPMSAGMLEYPPSVASGSPRSEWTEHKDAFKKRKTSPRWSQKVRVCLGTGLEGPPNDGCSWRKYGQKDILGANYPRAYYRCTHHQQGCLATKQVQRSDQDSSIFEVTYLERHTCIQSPHSGPAFNSLEREGPKEIKDHCHQYHAQQNQTQPQEKICNVGTGFGIEAEDLGNGNEIFPSFSFPSAAIESEIVEGHIFSDSMKENNFLGGSSPPFVSPETSKSNYFPVLSPCQMNSFGVDQNLQSSEFDLAEIPSAPTSVTNSPIGDLDFALDQVEFDPSFLFDSPEFFP